MWKMFEGFFRISLWGREIIKVGKRVDGMPDNLVNDIDVTEIQDEDPNYVRVKGQSLVVDAQLSLLRRELRVYRGGGKSAGERQST